MTYRYLMTLIERMNEEQKDSTVTVYVEDEYYPSYHLLYSEADDILDKDHPYLTLHFEDELVTGN